ELSDKSFNDDLRRIEHQRHPPQYATRASEYCDLCTVKTHAAAFSGPRRASSSQNSVDGGYWIGSKAVTAQEASPRRATSRRNMACQLMARTKSRMTPQRAMRVIFGSAGHR